MSYCGSWDMPLSNPGERSSQDAVAPNLANQTHPRFHHHSRNESSSQIQHKAPWRTQRSLPRGPSPNQPPSLLSFLRPRLILWPTFQVRNSAFYTVGRTFRIAPCTKVGDATNDKDEKFVTFDCFGREVICKPRICIVVEEHKGFSNVVAINGYGDRSLEKKSTNASEHAAARTQVDLSPPSTIEFGANAGQMLQQSICITPQLIGGKLATLRPGSVVDFGRVFPVDHYHEAEAFGFVAEESLDSLLRHYSTIRNKCAMVKRVSARDGVSGPSYDSNACLPMLYSNLLDPGRDLALHTAAVSIHQTVLYQLDRQQTMQIHKYISNSPGSEEERDPAYRQQYPEFFSFCRVFRLLSWEASPLDDESEITQLIPMDLEHNVPVLRRVLWLVVIQEGVESCKCLRLLTYEGRGVSELPPGLAIGDHSIIYTGRQIPEPAPGEIPSNPSERQMGLPVRVRRDNRMEKLFPASRLLWTRVYDVKLDVKAKSFGRVSSRCEHVLKTQFKQLNPGSAIDPGRLRVHEDRISAAYSRGDTSSCAKGVDRGVLRKNHPQCSDDDGSEDDVVSSSSSSQIFNAVQQQDPHRMYNPGDAVVLLTGKDGPSSGPNFKDFIINHVRLKQNDDGELVWEYSLIYSHGGKFQGGRYFDEDLLWPALLD